MNKAVPIYLLNSSFQIQAVYDDYESSYYTRSLYKPGKFEIRINYNKTNASLFARDLFVLFGGDNRRLGIINSVTKALGKNGKIDQVVTVSGYELRNVFERRIVIPPAGQEAYVDSGVAETVIKDFLANQCIGSGTASRNFTFLTLATDSARGSNCEISARLKNVGSTLWDLAEMVDMGISITTPTSGSVATVDVIPGVDRRSSQSTNPRAIFSVSSDTAGTATISDTDAKYKNLVYAAGQGVGSTRNILTVYSGTEPTGLSRREMYLDARDIEADADITLRANNKLLEYGQTVALDAEALQYSALQLGTDYDLGDLCTCEALGVTSDVRITSVMESWANNKYEINLTFGKPLASITSQVASIYNTGQTIQNFSEFGQNAAETLITTNAPKYLGRYLASNPASYNNGDWWTVYDTNDSPIQRGVWYSNNGTPARITTSSSTELQGKLIAALGDIAWAEENSYGIASDYGFSAIFQSLGVVTAFINSLFAQYIKVQTGGSIRGGDRYDESGTTVDGTKPGFFISASGGCKVAGIEFEGSQGGGVQWGVSDVAGSTSITSTRGVIAALSSSRMAYLSTRYSLGTFTPALQCYAYNGQGFTALGTSLSLTAGVESAYIARLSSSRVAAQAGITLGAYDFSGSGWSLVGSTLDITGYTLLCQLDASSVVCASGTSIRIYTFSGGAWSATDTDTIAISPDGGALMAPGLVALKTNTTAHIYSYVTGSWTSLASYTTDRDSLGETTAINGTDLIMDEYSTTYSHSLIMLRYSGSSLSRITRFTEKDTFVGPLAAATASTVFGTDAGSTGSTIYLFNLTFGVSVPYWP